MINILSALLFCISFNLDNIIIGIAYGVKKIKLEIYSNLLIAFITTFSTFISMLIGKLITQFITLNLANILASITIILIGLYFSLHSIINLFKSTKLYSIDDYNNILEYAKKTDKDNSNYIDIKEALAVSLSLSFNNIGMGIVASTSGINIFFVTIFTFISSISFLYIGINIGNKFIGKFLGKFAPLISGLILIILGIIELIY